MVMSFVLPSFPREVLDEILDLIESVSQGFPTYSLSVLSCSLLTVMFSVLKIGRTIFRY